MNSRPSCNSLNKATWHLAKEFVSSNSSSQLDFVDIHHSAAVLPSLSGFSDDFCTYSASSDLESLNLLTNLTHLCRTREGSIHAQQLLSKARPEQINQAIEAVLPCLAELTLDPYANYAIQTLFQSCSSPQRLQLLEVLRPQIVNIAKHPKGTHTLQTLISLCSTPEEENIYAQVFRGQVLASAFHGCASHVIQKLLSTIKNRHFLVKELVGSARLLAMNKVGLCVIKKALNDPLIVNELTEDILVLMQDPYANYAIQILVETWMEEVSFPVICAIRGKTAQLCMQKYSSNVIEKCLHEENMRRAIIDELLAEDKMPVLLGSAFGCYVLRTAAKQADFYQKQVLRQTITDTMRTFSYKTLKTRWDDILANLE